jgi:hypothetical protein
MLGRGMPVEEGCLVCKRDDDHGNLMLCEGCSSEYHYYCLDPPLRHVPHEEWYCGESVSTLVQRGSRYQDPRCGDFVTYRSLLYYF